MLSEYITIEIGFGYITVVRQGSTKVRVFVTTFVVLTPKFLESIITPIIYVTIGVGLV
jgi:hypothetical protein